MTKSQALARVSSINNSCYASCLVACSGICFSEVQDCLFSPTHLLEQLFFVFLLLFFVFVFCFFLFGWFALFCFGFFLFLFLFFFWGGGRGVGVIVISISGISVLVECSNAITICLSGWPHTLKYQDGLTLCANVTGSLLGCLISMSSENTCVLMKSFSVYAVDAICAHLITEFWYCVL